VTYLLANVKPLKLFEPGRAPSRRLLGTQSLPFTPLETPYDVAYRAEKKNTKQGRNTEDNTIKPGHVLPSQAYSHFFA
jgi:hypothetical protein